jgi:MOSC domain-containing protein YiiM
MPSPVIESIYRGGPRVLRDERGEWISSIGRERAEGAIEVHSEGFAGDRVAQPYHGGPDAALCVHLRVVSQFEIHSPLRRG